MQIDDTKVYQGPITLPVSLLTTFNVHPPTPVHQVTKDVHERFFDQFFGSHDGLGVPTEWWKGTLSLLQFLGNALIFRRP